MGFFETSDPSSFLSTFKKDAHAMQSFANVVYDNHHPLVRRVSGSEEPKIIHRIVISVHKLIDIVA